MKLTKILAISLALASFAWAAQENVILGAMQSELDRSMQNLAMQGQESPYFLSYRVTDQNYVTIEASMGTLTSSSDSRYRSLAVDLRVGSYDMDNSGVKKSQWDYDPDEWKYQNIHLPIDNDTTGIKHLLWLATDYYYKKALEDYTKKSKDRALNPEAQEEQVPDFSRVEPEVYIGDEVSLSVDKPAWEERLARYSAVFNSYKDITVSRVRLALVGENTYFVSSEGSKLQLGGIGYTLEIEASTRSKDGMPLSDFQRFTSSDGTFDDAKIMKAVTGMAEELTELRDAEACESYAGPVLIAAPASCAFVSGVLAPLLGADKELWGEGGGRGGRGGLGNKVGERVLPSSVSVYDDPTIQSFGGLALAGHYLYDDQGVKAEKVSLVERGVLKGFLTSRSPVKGFDKSNGHARRRGVAISNLIVETSAPQSFDQLKSRLIAEARRQGKPYGLLIASARIPEQRSGGNVIIFSDSDGDVIQGPRGMTELQPVQVYKVYTDGREEPVRGVEVLSGSPLSMLGKILALGSDPGVWSIGFGSSSIVAPSILVSELDIRKTGGTSKSLPILPPPE